MGPAAGEPDPSIEPDPLIGRGADVASIERALGRRQLVTITGLGGTGKTRIAREIVERRGAAGQPAVFVDLTSISTVEAVPAAIAAAMGVDESADRDVTAAIVGALVAGRALLVLDNLEQVIDARVHVGGLLAGAPEARILTTSRVRLGLPDEEVFPLGSLELPAAATTLETAPASELLLRRARDRGRLRSLEPEDAAALVEVCRRLDGLPLALELAAAWTTLLGPRAILRRLVDGRLDLSDPGRGRQASLDDVIEATLALVGPADRQLFATLGVFVGPFDEPTAQAVAGRTDVLPSLRSLESVALVRAGTDRAGEPWFDQLETIRAVALASLRTTGDLPATRQRFVRHFADRAEDAANRLRVRSWSEPVSGAALADPNVAAAFDRAVELGDGDSAGRLAASLGTYGMHKGLLREAVARLRTALAMDGLSVGTRVDVLNALASLRGELGDVDGLEDVGRAAADAARESGDTTRIVRALITQAITAPGNGEVPLLEAATLADATGYGWGSAVAWSNLGIDLADRGKPEEALEALARAQEAFAGLDDRVGVAMSLANRAEMELALGRHALALDRLEQVPALVAGGAGPAYLDRWATSTLAAALALNGRMGEAMTVLDGVARDEQEFESAKALVDWLDPAVTVLSFEHPVMAARCLGAVDRFVADAGQERTGATVLGASARRIETSIGRRRLEAERRAGRDTDPFEVFRQAAALVRRNVRRAPRDVAVPFGTLTDREREVLELLAAGRTDREIAERLGIATKTASVHVANLKGKLGVGTRVEAALFAREQLGARR